MLLYRKTIRRGRAYARLRFYLACNSFASAADACARERARREVLPDAQREVAAVIAQDEFPDEPALHLIGRIDALAEA